MPKNVLFSLKNCKNHQTLGQWRSKGGGSKWGHVPWGSGLAGATAHFLQSLNVFLSRNLDQSMLKNAYFWRKTVKILSASIQWRS